MVRLIDAHGARAIVLSYPWPEGVPNPALDAIRAAVDADAIPLVDLAPLFRERPAAVSVADLYAPDGHLTDAGYGVVAEAVAARVLALEITGP